MLRAVRKAGQLRFCMERRPSPAATSQRAAPFYFHTRIQQRTHIRKCGFADVLLAAEDGRRSTLYFRASGVTLSSTRLPSRSTIIVTGWPIFTASSA